MSEAFKWNLTPTERRIAEFAFGASATSHWMRRANAACDAIFELRGMPLSPDADHRAAMLAELRSEPAAEDYSTKRAGELLDALTLAAERDRLRALLEQILAAWDQSHPQPAWMKKLPDALKAAREELAR